MKKVVSLILVIAMIASLAVAASALHSTSTSFVEHGRHDDCTEACGLGHHCHWLSSIPVAGLAAAEVAACSENVKVLSITEGTKQTWTSCKQAITAAEMKAACEETELKHLTVFRQRNVEAEGEIELSVKNWQTGKKNCTVILFKGVEDEAWSIVGVSEMGDKDCSAVLPGSGAYVVAMSW